MAPRAKKAEVSEDTSMEDAPPSAQQAQETGDEMQEDPFEEEDGKAEEEEEEVVQRVRILPGSSATAASFEFLEEGHTLGNALRYIIMKNPDVEFCAYAIPHPSEAKMNIRIQTYDTTTATAALAKGLKDLEDLCDVVEDKFWTARNEYVAAQ
ncbi:RNA polymerase subunit AC19 [Neopestalotiopsis sp. 37M]|nr:RNA polymerase subunit AC19 [Neopestalotiopsis sp. 37M]